MKKINITGTIIFVAILVILLTIALWAIFIDKDNSILLQGQVETTEITISGTLPGRVERYYTEEGQYVKEGDTLVTISSPQAEAKYNQARALESATLAQNEKVDAGTRTQLIKMAEEVWTKAKADLELAKATHQRMTNLYNKNVITLQRKEEMEALYKSAIAEERAAFYQYEMAKAGAQAEDKATAYSLVMAAQSTVEEVLSALKDGALTSPIDGQVAKKYINESELVGIGTPILSIILIDKAYVSFNVREDLMPHFKMDKIIKADIPAIGKKDIPFRINYISPLGSFATWKSTKEKGSYDLKTFEIRATPTTAIADLRPGMSALMYIKNK